MNVLKFGILIITSLGFGIGFDQFQDKEEDVAVYENENGYGYCHEEEPFTYMLENLAGEDRVLVETKIDELLVAYDVTIDELFESYDVRHQFMDDLMEFMNENDIDFHHQSRYDDETHPHMRRYQ